MPIKVTCQCGKSLSVPDAAAGKQVRCPACKAAIAVPVGGAATAKPNPAAPTSKAPAARPVAAARPATAPANDLSDLFEQEGFKKEAGARCPACDAILKTGAVICTSCGFHLQSGEKVQGIAAPTKGSGGGHGGHGGHGGDDGKSQLAQAEEMMARDLKLQNKLATGGGLPWWMLLIILMLMVGGGVAAALTVIAIFADPTKLGGMGRLIQQDKRVIAGGVILFSFVPIYVIGFIVAVVAGFKTSVGQGFAVWLIPFYNYVFCVKRWKEQSGTFWMLTISLIGAIVGGVLVALGSRS